MFIIFLMLFTCVAIDATEGHFLTFIMPAYNRAHIIQKSLNSILEQELHVPYEVIVTDDGSTDKTLSILRMYEQRYDNFHVYIHTKNRGASEARNTCINHAVGDIIFNLDSDNLIGEKDTVQRLIDLMDETGCEIAAVQEMRYYNEQGKVVKSFFHQTTEGIYDLESLICNSRSPCSSGNYLFTKQSWKRAGKYKDVGVETWAFGFRQLATGSQVAILPHSYYLHRISSDSYWGYCEKNKMNDKKALENLRAFPEIFTTETNELLGSYDLNKKRIFADMQRGVFKLVPKQAREWLFKAYRLEEEGNSQEAGRAYSQAIKHGCEAKLIRKKCVDAKC